MSSVVVVVGSSLDRHSISDAVTDAGVKRAAFESSREAVLSIGESESAAPVCLLVDGEHSQVTNEISELRRDPLVANIPVIALVRTPSDDVYRKLFFAGADDVTQRDDQQGIQNRIERLVAGRKAAKEPTRRGDALVLHPDVSRRRVIGRTFRRAGFNIIFASEPKELEELVKGRSVEVALVSDQVPGGGFAAIAALRQHLLGLLVPGIVLSQDEEPEVPEAVRSRLPVVAAESDLSPPDNLLFLTNELMSPGGNDLRRSSRVLYSALCNFRIGGKFESAYGFTYNISREGLYVRSLTPPKRGAQAWIELRPPLSGEVVHVRAKVVWASEGPHTGMAPNGFAAEIEPIECPANDLQRYREGYDAFAP